MKELALIIIACFIGVLVFSQENTEWKDETVPFVGKEYPRTSFMSYEDFESARKNDFKNSPNYQSLNGKWKFHWVDY